MPRFAANLSMMYTEHAFLDRFAAAAADGFKGVEFLFPYDFSAQELAQRLQDHSLTQVLFNLSAGNFATGDRGMACHPSKQAQFLQSVDQALDYASALDCQRLHVMAGLIPPEGLSPAVHQCYLDNLRLACALAKPHGVTLLIEPINTRDMPGYYLNYQQQAHDVVAAVGATNLQVQMDFYHCQIMEGDLMTRLKSHLASIGHVQIAGVPNRQEPDAGEVAYIAILQALDTLDYKGWVGCEYRPAGPTSQGLGWRTDWGY